MKRFLIINLFFLLSQGPLSSGLLINEVVCGAPKDWVELFLYSEEDEENDISSLCVTMYYGTNEAIASEPVTLYSHDLPGTPWYDRFAVVYPAEPGGEDETDTAGDLNGNGIRELYCNNYYASFWNSDGVVSLDTDDDPANGGIIDFVAYSNRDGSPNSSIESYINEALTQKEWAGQTGGGIQLICVDIGPKGLEPSMCISRKGPADSNSMEDFAVSLCQTPGMPNLFFREQGGTRLISLLKNKILVATLNGADSEIPLFVYRQCSISFRLFTGTGREVYESTESAAVDPGPFSLKWQPGQCRFKLITGLYIGKIEAVNASQKLSEEKTVYVIVSR